MAQIKGIAVVLHVKTQTGTDGLNHPIYSDSTVTVENVLVSPVTAADLLTNTSLEGKTAAYTLAIPKGDDHIWENTEVEFFNQKWKTIGLPIMGIEGMIPLSWNKKVNVCLYE